MQFECYMKTLFISCSFSFQAHLVEIALSLFNFCFVLLFSTRLSQKRPMFCLSCTHLLLQPPIKLIDSLRLKGSHFSLSTQQAQDHTSQVTGAQEEPENLKETGGEGSSMAFSSGKKKGSWGSRLKGHPGFCSECSMTVGTSHNSVCIPSP